MSMTQEELDRKLAEEIAAEEYAKAKGSGLLFQFSAHKDEAPSLNDSELLALETALGTLAPILRTEAATGGYVNAHAHTSTQIRGDLPKVLAIDSEFNISNQSISLKVVESEILKFLSDSADKVDDTLRVQSSHVQTSFARVQKEGPVEAGETKAHVVELISRVWTLASDSGQDYQGIVASCFSDNIADGGGCLAGLVARLYMPYTRLVHDVLALKKEQGLLGVAEEKVGAPRL